MPKRPGKSSPDRKPGAPARKNAQSPQADGSCANQLLAADFQSLEEFCSSIELTEVSVDEWSSVHQELDLTVFVYLSADEARLGCRKEVKFSRCISGEGEGTRTHTRERCSKDVEVPGNVGEGHQITVPGLGDQRNGLCGSLQIIVKIRS